MSVYKKKNGKWYCQFMVKGERIHKLLDGATDKKQAIELEDAERFKIRQQQNGIIEREKKKFQLSFMMQKYKESSLINRSYKDSCRQADYILNYFGKTTDVTKIKPSDVEGYTRYLLNRGLKNATVNRHLTGLKRAYNIMINDELLNYNPVCKIKMLEVDNRRYRYLTKTEWLKFKLALPPITLEIVMVALLSGLRLGNVLNLKWEQIDMNLRTIELLKSENKGKKYIKLGINQALYDLLRSLEPKSKGFVFINPKTGKPYKTIKKSFKTALDKAGIKDFKFHDLRRTVGTWLLTSGVDIRTVQSILAHSDVRTTERYLAQTNEQNRKAMDVLNSLV